MSQCLIAALVIGAIIVVCVIMMQKKSSENYAVAPLRDKIRACQRFGGSWIVGSDLCKMPPVITNSHVNYQMAGRLCELDGMYEGQGCRTPKYLGYVDNPYAKNANAGRFSFSP